MVNPSLWQVNIGEGVGPLTLGATRRQVLESLQAFGIQTSFDPQGHETLLRIASLSLTLVFADDGSQVLRRIDIANPQVCFANWDILGKPIHKAVRLFKCADHETLWCSAYDEASQRELELNLDRNSEVKVTGDAESLRRGTLWIPSLGLGFTLRESKIVELHVTQPEYAPKFGTGTWNVAQKTMSELGRIPKRSGKIAVEESPRAKLVRASLKVSLMIAPGMIVWSAIDLQLKWNRAPDTPATVIAVIPPPPAPFGDQFHLRYLDENSQPHEVIMERMDFFDAPHMDSIVNIRYLPGSPEQPLGDRRYGDVGMTYGVPRAGIVVAIYMAIQLMIEIYRWFRARTR